MKKTIIIAMAVFSVLFTSCKRDIEYPYNFVKTGIGYDENYLYPGAYTYSELDNQLEIIFNITNNTAITSVKVTKIIGGVETVLNDAFPLTECQGVVTLAPSDLELAAEGDGASIKVYCDGVTKEFPVALASCWTVSVSKYFKPIAGKTANDTIKFKAVTDDWVDLSGCTWNMTYQIGANGALTQITPTIKKTSSSNITASFINNVSAIGAVENDTVFVNTEIVANSITKSTSYEFIVAPAK
jgi:hypothetical protein